MVVEELQDIGAAQKELADLLRVATARKRASMEVDRVRTASRGSRGSMSQPPSRAVSRGSLNQVGSTSRSASRSIAPPSRRRRGRRGKTRAESRALLAVAAPGST